MPNRNYLRGRRFEYQTMDRWRVNYKVLRTAGSHGEFDVISYVYAEDDLPDGTGVHAPSSIREVHKGYEYLTYVRPIKGYGIQCKVKKIRKRKGKK